MPQVQNRLMGGEGLHPKNGMGRKCQNLWVVPKKRDAAALVDGTEVKAQPEKRAKPPPEVRVNWVLGGFREKEGPTRGSFAKSNRNLNQG